MRPAGAGCRRLRLVLPLGVRRRGCAPSDYDPAAQLEVMRKLDQLPINQGVLLGQARVLGEFNQVAKDFHLDRTDPRGRDFTFKMVWAAERNRALFCGANHNVPHRLNDVWEFDLPALAWILLYAPDNPRDYVGLGKDHSDVVFQDGVFLTKRGGPAIIAHSWWGLTHDPKRKRIYVQRWHDTFCYDPAKNEWATLITGDADSGNFSYGHDARSPMYYDPASGHGLLVEFSTNRIWAFDPDQVKWTLLAPQGDPLPEGKKRLAFVDQRYNVLVVLHDTTVWAYRYQLAPPQADPVGGLSSPTSTRP